MNRPVRRNPFLEGNFAPLSMECDAPDLPITGEMPRELYGSLYRIGPNPAYTPRDPHHHWFFGDGMVHAFHVSDGRVSYGNRWVQTPKLRRERAAGRSLYGTFGNPMTTDPEAMGGDSGVANTNIVWHAGRLLALEEGHKPTEMDPHTLTTAGYHDYQGRLDGPMTAHPKICPETGQMIGFAYAPDGLAGDGKTVNYYIIEPDGTLATSFKVPIPYFSMMHDFLVTRHHVLFPVMPLTGDLGRAMKGLPFFAWEPERPVKIGVMRRDAKGPEGIRWFEGDPSYVFHPMNAWEEDGRIVCDVARYGAAPLFPMADGSPGDPAKAVAHLTRWTFDLDANTDTFSEVQIDDLDAEFPRIDDRRTGLANRHGYFAFRTGHGTSGSFDGLAHVDHKTGKRLTYRLPSADAALEPVFVPRSADADEGDGWLLTVIYRGEERVSELAVFEAADVAAGPIARAHLSHRVPFGFHGNWRQG
jgi:carotenoid cleavage dioxygenase